MTTQNKILFFIFKIFISGVISYMYLHETDLTFLNASVASILGLLGAKTIEFIEY
jgi:hypothetical protein